MKVRCRLDGTVMTARMELLKGGRARPRFSLLVNDAKGRRFTIGRLEAAIGYELIESTPEEVAAMKLAGFHLGRASRPGRSWRRLASVLCAMRKREARAARRWGPKDVMPDDDQSTSPAMAAALQGQTPEHGSTDLHPREAGHKCAHSSAKLAHKSKTHGHRRKSHGYRH